MTEEEGHLHNKGHRNSIASATSMSCGGTGDSVSSSGPPSLEVTPAAGSRAIQVRLHSVSAHVLRKGTCTSLEITLAARSGAIQVHLHS